MEIIQNSNFAENPLLSSSNFKCDVSVCVQFIMNYKIRFIKNFITVEGYFIFKHDDFPEKF